LLGKEACDELTVRFSSRDAWEYDDDPESHVWWTQILPEFVDTLVSERDNARAECDALKLRCTQVVKDADHMLRGTEQRLVAARDEAHRERDAAEVVARDAAEDACAAAVVAHDAAVDDECAANMRVVSVQQAQQQRIDMYCAHNEQLQLMIEHIIEKHGPFVDVPPDSWKDLA
jgi:hypothetical protein